MVNFKIILGLKDGKTVQKVVSDQEAKSLVGLKIGDKVDGSKIGLAGYELEITGGSDNCGFPMRKDVSGSSRKKILITKGVGNRESKRGIRKRRTVCGNTIHTKISQINLRVLKEGKAKLEETPKEGAEEKADKPAKQEKPKAEKAPDKPKEKPKEEKAPVKEEKPKKEEPKKADKPKEEKVEKKAPKVEAKKEAPADKPKEEKKE